MQVLKSLILFGVSGVLASCVSVPDSALLVGPAERAPTSVINQCEDLFASSPLQRLEGLRQRLEARKSAIVLPKLTSDQLQQFRLERLRASTVSLAELVEDIRAVSPQSPTASDIVRLAELIHPSWTAEAVEGELTSQSSLLNRAKSLFKKDRSKTPFDGVSPERQRLMAEYLIRFEIDRLRGWNTRARATLFSYLWQNNEGRSDFKVLLTDARSAHERLSLMNEYFEIWQPLSDGFLASDQAVNSWLIKVAGFSQSELEHHLDQVFSELPSASITTDFAEQLISEKRMASTKILELAEAHQIQFKNRHLFHKVLLASLTDPSFDVETLQIWDRWVESSVQRDFQEALQDLDCVLPNRAKLLSEKKIAFETPDSLRAYTAVLSHASSTSARRLALESLARLGPKAVRTYIGNDRGSWMRARTLLQVGITDGAAERSVVKALTSTPKGGVDLLADRGFRARAERAFPTLKIKATDDLSKILMAADALEQTADLDQVLKHQDDVESALDRALSSVISANAPPALFHQESRPWTAFLRSVPRSMRADIVRRLLRKNSTSVATLAQLISELDPIDGVGETVTSYLAGHAFTGSNRTDFSQEQVLKMFGGDRFEKFFPGMKGVELDGTIRTRFIIALRTNPKLAGSLNKEWLQEKIDSDEVKSGVHAAFGFRPALRYDRLPNQLRNGLRLDGTTPERQAAGLIVQSYYEKSGATLMYRLDSRRGQAHVENVGPSVNNSIERSLTDGALSKQSDLVQSLFVNGWALDSDSSLIERIRDRAVYVAGTDRGFRSLRVEIHNFPTPETLRRVKDYRRRLRRDDPDLPEVDALISELETFLQVEGSASGIRSTIQSRLRLSEENRNILLKMTGDFDRLDDLQKLERLVKIRDRYRSLKEDEPVSSTRPRKRMTLLQDDRALSEAAIATFSRWLNEKFASADFATRVKAVGVGLAHLRRDYWISAGEEKQWLLALKSLSAESGPTLDKLTELNEIVSGFVDQIYFRTIDQFGFFDNALYHVHHGDQKGLPRFTDASMRSGFTFLLSKIVDSQALEIASAKNLEHQIGDVRVHGLVDVHNAGDAVGILRINQDPMALTTSEIGVFEQMPVESAPMAGIVTVGTGARLSHLQLLARSLKIPNVQISKDLLQELKKLDGSWVRLRADESGQLTIENADGRNELLISKAKVKIPKANLTARSPISFSALRDSEQGHFAGPKGVTLAQLFQSGGFRNQIPDGEVLPFGFFDRYADHIGLKPLLEALAKTKLKNRRLVGLLSAQVALRIEKNPLPPDLLDEVERSVRELQGRTKNSLGFFFRSDTNVEDLPEFNGAGLNESVPNVQLQREQIDEAIRRVWTSPYKEASIYWRGQALGRSTVTLAQPSVVVMPTIQAASSGVLISRGGPQWERGRGRLSANFGIGSVVQAERPVEEYSFTHEEPLRLSFSASATKPVADTSGGLIDAPVESGSVVLTLAQAKALNKLGQRIEQVLGDQPHGWDIEWAIEASTGRLVILQARPNF